MPKETLIYLSIFSIENDVTKSLSYEKEIKEYAAPQKARKNVLQMRIRQLIRRKISC